MDNFNRRDFLKLAGLLPLSLASTQLGPLAAPRAAPGGKKNILVIVFDAFSAYNMSLHGYARQTTPNLERLAGRAIVYHNHHASSSFTTPGTASLLTGTHPWTHRANHLKDRLDERFVERNLFSAFPDHYRIAYTHNPWADIFLEQLRAQLEEWVPMDSLFLKNSDTFVRSLFRRDKELATVSWTRNTDIGNQGYAYSLLLSHVFEKIRSQNLEELKQRFPRGVPNQDGIGTEFFLETAIVWTAARLMQVDKPFLGYFHFLPPHDPYKTSARFYNRFAGDGFHPPDKPEDLFTRHVSGVTLRYARRRYDEFILYVDEQFGRLFDMLEQAGLLEDTWLVLTSDHGEMHERGISTHGFGALYQPVVRIPLMIFEPGRTSRLDVHTPTSAIDVLPTLLHLAGQPPADWSEGRLLPPFAPGPADTQRSLFAIKADGPRRAPLSNSASLLLKDRYKLIYDFGYEGNGAGEFLRLFDVVSDPEEMQDLYRSKPALAGELLNELKQKLAEATKLYARE